VHKVQIRVTRTGRTDFDHDLSGSRQWFVYFDEFGFMVPGADLQCAHVPVVRSNL
jgi:hypothetical protein